MTKTKIGARIVAHSVDPRGNELFSIEATLPRIILAETLTHRMHIRSTSSSRAIPFSKMVHTVETDPFIPIAWQKKHSGMQGTEYHFDETGERFAPNTWLRVRDKAVEEAKMLHNNCEVTKQLANRLLEPFMWTKVLITSSKEGWLNFFYLRCPQYEFTETGDFFYSKLEWIEAYNTFYNLNEDTNLLSDIQWRLINKGAAEIHIMELAESIYNLFTSNSPKQLKAGEWHIVYEDKLNEEEISKILLEGETLLDAKIKITTSMAARTSYTIVGEEKEIDYRHLIGLHDRLIAQEPAHSSPMEHNAQVQTQEEYDNFIKGDISKGVKEENKGWCYSLKGFKSYRYILENEKQ